MEKPKIYLTHFSDCYSVIANFDGEGESLDFANKNDADTAFDLINKVFNMLFEDEPFGEYTRVEVGTTEGNNVIARFTYDDEEDEGNGNMCIDTTNYFVIEEFDTPAIAIAVENFFIKLFSVMNEIKINENFTKYIEEHNIPIVEVTK